MPNASHPSTSDFTFPGFLRETSTWKVTLNYMDRLERSLMIAWFLFIFMSALVVGMILEYP